MLHGIDAPVIDITIKCYTADITAHIKSHIKNLNRQERNELFLLDLNKMISYFLIMFFGTIVDLENTFAKLKRFCLSLNHYDLN